MLKIVNLAHGEFLMIGMYVSFWLFQLFNIDPFLSLAVAGPLLFILGVGIERLLLSSLRKAPQTAHVLLMIGVSLILVNSTQFAFTADWRTLNTSYASSVFRFGEVTISLTRLVASVAAFAIGFALYAFLRNTTVGKSIRAIAQDREVATIMGIRVSRLSSFSFGLGALLAGLAGVLLSLIFTIHPYVGIENFLIRGFVIVILGGMESITGAMLGGILFGLAESLGAAYLGNGYESAIGFFIFIIMLLVRPSGLLGKSRV